MRTLRGKSSKRATLVSEEKRGFKLDLVLVDVHDSWRAELDIDTRDLRTQSVVLNACPTCWLMLLAMFTAYFL